LYNVNPFEVIPNPTAGPKHPSSSTSLLLILFFLFLTIMPGDLLQYTLAFWRTLTSGYATMERIEHPIQAGRSVSDEPDPGTWDIYNQPVECLVDYTRSALSDRLETSE